MRRSHGLLGGSGITKSLHLQKQEPKFLFYELLDKVKLLQTFGTEVTM